MSFDPAQRRCADSLFSLGMRHELVISFEVAEHIPPQFHPQLIRSLAEASSKYLIFSAARPGQGGTGHVNESMHRAEWWIERFARIRRSDGTNLRLLPGLTRAIRTSAFPDRAFDFGSNLVALGAPDVADLEDVPELAVDCTLEPNRWCRFQNLHAPGRPYYKDHGAVPRTISKREKRGPVSVERPSEEALNAMHQLRKVRNSGFVGALWPTLHDKIRRLQKGELRC